MKQKYHYEYYIVDLRCLTPKRGPFSNYDAARFAKLTTEGFWPFAVAPLLEIRKVRVYN
jgi:hypothetical protein